MATTMAEKIRYLRKRHGLTLEDVATQVGVGKSTVRKWETGMIANMKRDKIAALATALHTTPAYLMGWAEEERPDEPPAGFSRLPSTKAVPRVGQIACGQPVLAESHITGYDEVPARWRADFTLVCKGDSMAPKINDGDLVAIRKQETVEQGQIAAVRIGTEATLKMVFIHDDFVELRAVNPDYPSIIKAKDSMDGIAIEGLAVGFWREI